jgi:HEAT repeat protein
VVPALSSVVSKDGDADARSYAAEALGEFGPAAESAVSALSTALTNDADSKVRTKAAKALAQIGPGAKGAGGALSSALAKDTSSDVREEAADALGDIGPGAREAVPALSAALTKGTDPYLPLRAARALEQLSAKARDNKRTDMVNQLAESAKLLEAKGFPFQATQVRTVVDIPRAIQPPWYQNLLEKAGEHPGLAGLVTAYFFLLVLWLVLLRKYPLTLWQVSEIVEHIPKAKLPGWLGGIEISVAYLLLVGFFHYHPRVLDSWVSRRITSARDHFGQIDTVQQREVHVEVPLELDSKVIPDLKPEDLKASLSRNSAYLLIWGEGGAGKRSLASQIARWGMSDDAAIRPSAHRMLPVMIEQDLDLEVGQGKAVLMEVIRGRLKNLTGETEVPSQELVRHLLKQKRVLLIFDGLSELSEATRKKVRPIDPEFVANALVVTSRIEESLDGVEKTTIHPMRIQGNRLSSFMEAYLGRRSKRSLFTDAEFFDGCIKLSVMVGDRDITVLLAKLFAEQMIASKEGAVQNLPDSIPDLMLRYLNELNRRRAGLEDRMVHSAAKIIAWECLKETFLPTSARLEAVLVALGGDTAQGRIDFLEKNLLLLQVIGAGRDRVKFVLDPLAEYLAGLYIVENYRDNERLWRDFLDKADALSSSPSTINGFLLSVRDCCLAADPEKKIPSFVLEELATRARLEIRRSDVGWQSETNLSVVAKLSSTLRDGD